MAILDTVLLYSKNTKKTQGILVDSPNNFKSSLSLGCVFNTSYIAADWVEMYTENQPKFIDKFQDALNKHPYFSDWYSINNEDKSISVHGMGKAQNINFHLSNLQTMGILKFEPLFSCKINSTEFTKEIETGFLIHSTI